MRKIADWLHKGPFTPRDLALYRIVYGSIGLLTLNQYGWMAELPGSFFAPPPGPFALAPGFPPIPVLVTLEVALAIALVALLIGFATPVASIVVFVILLVGEGLSYSTGKIDHSILMVIIPLMLAFARWGDALSVDAILRPEIKQRAPRQWAMRLLAVSIGSAMMTAGLPKLYNGWLDLGTQASYGYQGLEYYSHARQSGLAEFLVSFDAPWFWEILDWSTVVLECGLLFAALSWRSWRIGLAIFTLFHMGVMLALNIAFWQNIVAYGAFVSWAGFIPTSKQEAPGHVAGRARTISIAVATTVIGGVLIWWAADQIGQVRVTFIAPVIVSVGFAFGVVFLARVAWQILRRVTGRSIDSTSSFSAQA